MLVEIYEMGGPPNVSATPALDFHSMVQSTRDKGAEAGLPVIVEWHRVTAWKDGVVANVVVRAVPEA